MTRKYKITNEYVRGSIGVASIVDNMKRNEFRWVGHVTRRENLTSIRMVMELSIDRRRERGSTTNNNEF